jgi:FkbM family methyltransferase
VTDDRERRSIARRFGLRQAGKTAINTADKKSRDHEGECTMLHVFKLWCKGRLSAITRWMLGKHVRGLLVQSPDHLFLVDPEDYGVGRRLRLHGRYGEEELDRLVPLISAESDVLVVGTHIGTLAIPLASRCRSVSAIEANPDTFTLLEGNVAINRVENVEAFNLAASNTRRKLKFLVNRSNSGGSKIAPKTRQYQYYYDKPKEITVQGIPLDEQFPDRRFDLIVMDIEGSEYDALRGMQQLLSRVQTLVVEFVPHHLRNVSDVTVEQFLEPLSMFDSLFVPTLQQTVNKDRFADLLQRLYDRDRSDDGIIFQKSS